MIKNVKLLLIKRQKENNSINFDFSNLDMAPKINFEEVDNNENEEFNVSKIDIEDTNDLYMPYEKLNLDNNKNDIIEELVNEIRINNKKVDDNNKDYVNLKNIFLHWDTNFSTKYTSYKNETLSNKKKFKTFINKKTKRK